MEFEARNIEADDFHGIKHLLKQVCVNYNYLCKDINTVVFSYSLELMLTYRT